MTQGVLKTHGICLMMYFKNNWNALVHFFYFMDILEEKKHIHVYIYIDFQYIEYIYKTYHIFLFLFIQIFNQ